MNLYIYILTLLNGIFIATNFIKGNVGVCIIFIVLVIIIGVEIYFKRFDKEDLDV